MRIFYKGWSSLFENHPLLTDDLTDTVSYAFRDINKPMGVATYKTSSELPCEYRGILPEPDELRKLM